MITLRSAVALASFLFTISGAAVDAQEMRPATLQVFVSPDGNDAADGLAERVTDKSGPVRSLERARDVVRDVRRRDGGPHAVVEVIIGAGIYRLSQPLILEGRDSGAPGAPVIYRAAAGADARISGGVPVTGWVPAPGGLASAGFDPALFEGGCPTQLFVNGERRERPRLPAEGTFAIGAPPPLDADGRTINDHFITRQGDLPAGLEVGPGTEVVILDAWTASRMHATSYDPQTGRLGVAGSFAGHGKVKNLTAGLPYYVENPVVERPASGLWRCDLDQRTLFYSPAKGENLATAMVIAPRASAFLSLRGTANDPVHDLRFEQLKFEHAAWTAGPDGWGSGQAEVDLPATIEAENCRDITFTQIGLSHVGTTGIGIRKNCINVEVSASQLDDIGGGGIAIGSSQSRPAPGTSWERGGTGTAETHHVRITGNRITRLGRVYRGAVGVWSGQAHHVTISGNVIRDLFYTGISVGWSWNSNPSLSHDNLIEGNVISKFGQGVLSDFGGIYTLGRQDGTRVVGNRIFDGQARTYAGNGLYADEGSAGITFSNNVVSGTSHAAIHLHFGKGLNFSGNVATDFGEAAIRCSRAADSDAVMFANNVFFNVKGIPFTFGACKASAFAFEDNVVKSGNSLETWDKSYSESNWKNTASGL